MPLGEPGTLCSHYPTKAVVPKDLQRIMNEVSKLSSKLFRSLTNRWPGANPLFLCLHPSLGVARGLQFRRVESVGTSPPDDTWHAFLAGSAPFGSPQEDTWRASPIRTPSGMEHGTRKHHIRTTAISHSDDRHILFGYSERTGMMTSHFPRSLTAATPPRSLLAARRVMMTLPPPRGIMTSQKVSLPLKRETELLILYIRTFTQGGRACVHLATTWITGTRGLNIGAVCGNSLIQSPTKMSTPSRSRSSGRGEEDNSEWRRAIERRQLASERQLQALFQEIERLREENTVLRIQASSTGPPRRQHSRSQVANSRHDPESIYPGAAGAIPGTCNVRPHEPHMPMHRAPHEESSDSTHFSAKRQRDKKPQLSDSMRARLGPQEPRRLRPPVVTTWGAHPDPMVTPMV
ncbi:hypothetical protein CK203_012671 [Vitis vinifera]|uniref:Uncharacterized protein n=1 Tax=Vitis vinifera TaxID=29760 RepID=A0A438KMF8_VITVI|nr:hypothetical protein CK203_012671 [Vitis vinifera]